MRKRGDYRPLITKKDIFPIIVSVIMGIMILVVFSVLGWKIYRPQTITQTFEKKPSFQKEEEVDGKRVLLATTQSSTRRPDGGHENPRICDEFLVLHFRSQTATEDLAEKLQKINGVERAEPVGPYKMIVERPCYERYESLWTWKEVWENIRPVILPYLPQKQALNLPTPRHKQRGAVLFYRNVAINRYNLFNIFQN